MEILSKGISPVKIYKGKYEKIKNSKGVQMEKPMGGGTCMHIFWNHTVIPQI